MEKLRNKNLKLNKGHAPSLDRALQRLKRFSYDIKIKKNIIWQRFTKFNFGRCEKRSARLSAGYTLVEVLVSISVTVLLSTILILYNHSGESQIALIKEQAKIIGILLKAKGLAIQTYSSSGGDSPVCSYGVHFNAVSGIYLIFKDLAEPCSSSDNKYSGPNEDHEKYKLESSLRFLSLGLIDMVFIPPDPIVVIDGDAGKKGNFEITIGLKDGNSERKIKVNNFGQITAN